VIAVVTGELMAQHNLAWMPTMSYDTQAVLATDKVRFQGQEVAAVIATDPYLAADARDLIEVDYEPLGVVTSPQAALAADAPLIRDEKDRGVLMICDPRLIGKPYGKAVWRSLPPMRRTRELAEVESFFAESVRLRHE